MIVDFGTKDLHDAMKGVKQIFSKGPLADKSSTHDCLVASKEDGTITIESACQGLYARVQLKADIEEGGKVVVNRETLAGLRLGGANTVARYAEGDTHLKLKSGQLDGQISVSQESKEVEDQRPINSPDLVVSVPCDVLRVALKRVTFALMTDQKHAFLKAMVSFKGKKVSISTNDTYRAALFQANLEKPLEELSFVIPANFLASVLSAIPADHEVSFGANESVIRVAGGAVDVYHPVVEDEGVADIESSVKGLNSEEPTADFLLNVAETREAFASVVSIVPSSLGADLRLIVSVKEDGNATVKVDTTVGSAKCKFTVSNVSVQNNKPFLLSSKYVMEFLGLLGEGEAVMRLWDKRVLIRSEQFGTSLLMSQLNEAETSQSEEAESKETVN